MSDAANVYIVQHPRGPAEGGIYLYTHWGGCDLPGVLQRALARGKSRWADEPYLARIIFSEMIAGDVFGTADYGISTCCGENEHDLLVVDCKRMEVGLAVCRGAQGTPQPHRVWSFPDFLDVDVATEFADY